MHLRVITLQWTPVISWSRACMHSNGIFLHQLPGPCKQVWSNAEV